MSETLYKGKMVKRYGLSCGYWTNRASKIDKHVWAHININPDDEIFDLCDCQGDPSHQYKGEKLHQCKEGIA